MSGHGDLLTSRGASEGGGRGKGDPEEKKNDDESLRLVPQMV